MSKVSSVVPATITKRFQRLKASVAQGESALRWIDVYAAENAYLHANAGLRLEQEQAALFSDLTLILSFASSRGEAGLDVEGLLRYRAYVSFSWELFEDRAALASALTKLAHQLTGASSEDRADAEAVGLRPELVLADGRWFLARHASLKNAVDEWLGARLRSAAVIGSESSAEMSVYIERLFEFGDREFDQQEFDHQALAAAQALFSSLVLVSGGPGTGKTTTAAKLLMLRLLKAQSAAHADEPLKAVCLAPTGKAAQRLASSLRGQSLSLLERLSLDPDLEALLRSALPDEGMTIHRYLIECGKPMDELSSYSREADNDLVFGVKSRATPPTLVVIDESSMIDLALMERLVAALDDKTCVVLMGDPYQLPPVEVGQVFSDWVQHFMARQVSDAQFQALASYLPYSPEEIKGATVAADAHADVSEEAKATTALNPLVRLHKSYRFGGALAELASIVKDKSFVELSAFAVKQAGQDVEVQWLDIGQQERLLSKIEKSYETYAKLAADKASLADLQNGFDDYQILCSTRLGALGTEAVNARVERMVRRTCEEACGEALDAKLFHGQAILVEANYPALDIYNGDIGFVIDDEHGRVSFQFYRGEHLPPIVVASHKLGHYSLAYALTVHKSQGSEYRSVSVVVAPYAAELVSRRLLYTGITRSKECLSLYVGEQQFKALLES